MENRRGFLKKVGLASLAGIATNLVSNEKLQALESLGNTTGGNDAFTLPKLPYAYNALEPFIDAQTMEIHYTKHHQGYVTKLNEIKSTNVDYQVDDITKCEQLDPTSKGKSPFRNNLGGHVNHCLFWTLLKPNIKAAVSNPTANLAEAIVKEFTSIDEFKKQFTEKATKHFGSGWCWLITRNNKLEIVTTENQENPFMRKDVVDKDNVKVVLALDVWEHAYYLKYQNKRVDYITNWWNVVNWEMANTYFVANK
jgi:superoxide dismutase, Fe-Mn family